MSDHVQARWACAFPVEVPGQGVIQPGDLALIPADEARDSDHWQPVALDDLKKSELVEVAEEVGVDPTGKTKSKLASAITKAEETS